MSKRTGRSRVLAVALLGGSAALIAWTVHLGLSLPHRFAARHWNLAWVGFDALIVAALVFTAWAAFFKRTLLMSGGFLVCAALLLCDAWFDSVTSWGSSSQGSSLAFALSIEVPAALFFVYLSRRAAARLRASRRGLTGGAADPLD
jgi:hypothetical protein